MRLAAVTALVLLAAAAPAAAQGPERREREARAELRRSLGPQAVVTPRFVAALDGALTPPRSGDATDIAARYVRRHVAALGLGRADLGSLGAGRSVALAGGGEQVRWRQFHDGVPVIDGELRVTVGEDGRVYSVSGSPEADLDPGEARLDAVDALRAAGAEPGRVVSGPERAVRFAGGERASLVVFRGRLVWQVVDGAAAVIVDAVNGRELERSDLVRRFEADVFPLHPATGAALVDEEFPDVWFDDDPPETLSGPHAHVWADADGDDIPEEGNNAPDLGEEIEIGGMGPAFQPFSHSDGGCSDAALCTWDGGDPDTRDDNRDANAIQAFFFVNRFRDWLAAEVGVTGLSGGDRVQVQTINEGDLNNAGMYTPPPGLDGHAPTMELFLFSSQGEEPPEFRDVDAAADALIVAHEYAHAYTDRLVGYEGVAYRLSGDQGNAMAEGFSDYYAFDHAADDALVVDGPQHADLQFGAYTDRIPRTSREQALDCPVGSPADACAAAGGGGYTLRDFGKIHDGGAEPHADGEIWAQTLWDVRGAIGGDATREILATALPQLPTRPSFLDMRNAMLTAEQQRFGGSHAAALWSAFAARGMGCGARFSVNDATPVEDFEVPAGCRPAGTIGVSNAQPLVGDTIVLDAAGIAGGNVPSQSWRWDLGDGRVVGPSGASRIEHAFATAGTKLVQVSVSNVWGATTVSTVVDVAPRPEAPEPELNAPAVKLPRYGRRGRVRVRVRCDEACSGTAKLKVKRRLARRLGTGRVVGRKAVRLDEAGSKRVTVRLKRRAVRGMRRAGLRRVRVRLVVNVRDEGGRRERARRTVRVRR